MDMPNISLIILLRQNFCKSKFWLLIFEEREFNEMMGVIFTQESEQIVDPAIAETVGRMEKPARDLELMYKRLAEGGLTDEEEKHAKVFVRLLEKYPDAFDKYQDGKGSPILKSRETARSGAVYLWVTERGAVEFHSSSGMNLLSDESRNGLRGQFGTYLKDSFVNDVDAVVSGRIKDKDAGRWVSFPRESTPLSSFLER
ncbi:MAG: hypothetical protein AAB768_03705 [Patescibacteria group bacterium]